MSEYYPDKYVIVKITDKETSEVHYRVLGTWHGGYTSGDYYRLNSGIDRYTVTDFGTVQFYGASGSVYEVAKKMYGMSLYSQGWLMGLIERSKADLEMEVITLEEFEDEWNS